MNVALSLQHRRWIVSTTQLILWPYPQVVFAIPAPACPGDVEGERELGPALCQAQGYFRPGADAADGIDGFDAARADRAGGFER